MLWFLLAQKQRLFTVLWVEVFVGEGVHVLDS